MDVLYVDLWDIIYETEKKKPIFFIIFLAPTSSLLNQRSDYAKQFFVVGIYIVLGPYLSR